MCEQVVVRSARPFQLGELWELADRLETYGLAGFGWGMAWIDEADGTLRSHRDVRAFRDDPEGRAQLGDRRSRAALVHLRRPSKLSTLQLPDTQPFDDPAGRYSFSHNGDLRDYHALRQTFRAQGRIHGRADTEVGARWLEDAWTGDDQARERLQALHARFGGQANLAVLTAGGAVHHYAGNRENPVFGFRLGDLGVATTGLYSLDRSVFRFVAPGATDRRLIREGSTVTLDGAGHAIVVS